MYFSKTYAKDNLPTRYVLSSTRYADYDYDSLDRLTKRSFSTETPIYNNYIYKLSDRGTYTYGQNVTGNYRTTQLAREIVDKTAYDYYYDKVGNITSINTRERTGEADGTTVGSEVKAYRSYSYDAMNQLLREDDVTSSKSTVYSYDDLGNILSKSVYPYTAPGTAVSGTPQTKTYTYSKDGKTGWNNLLTNYNGETITYDAIGNPTTYLGANLTWFGRQLTSYKKGNKTISCTYDADGLRGTKTVDGVTSKYQYINGQLMYEKRGSADIYYFYDSYGHFAAFKYCDGSTEYLMYAVTNSQGDVLGLYTGSGVCYVKYEYDAWGNVTETNAAGGALTGGYKTISDINPFRYRGYYYDAETGLYYLQSRYYDPEIGKFISPDDSDTVTATPTELTDKNLFAYCDNNPVMREDKGGHFWNIIAGAVGGALIGGGIQVVSNLVSGNKWSDGLGTAMLTGAASGALAATGVGLLGSIAGNAAISMAGNTTNQLIKNKGFNNFDVGDMLIDGAIGGVAGAIGGRGMGKSANISTLNKNLTKNVLSGSSKVAIKGAKYYVSQTSKIYWRYLAKPILKSWGAGLLGSTSKAILSR